MGDSGAFSEDESINHQAKELQSPPWKRQHKSPVDALIDLCIDSFCKPCKYSDLLSKNSASIADDFRGLKRCGEPILKLLLRLSNSIRYQNGDVDHVIRRLDDLVAISTEKFYAFPFKDVPVCWRELFREASFLKLSALAIKERWDNVGENMGGERDHSVLKGDLIDEMVRTIDMALIMAGSPPEPVTREAVDAVLWLLQEYNSELVENAANGCRLKRQKVGNETSLHNDTPSSTSSAFAPPVLHPVLRMKGPSFDKFETFMQKPRNTKIGAEPVIIPGVLERWPARNDRSWNSPLYLMSKTIGGRRLVPIETGRSYVDEGWGQKIMTFKEFMDEYITVDSTSRRLASGYLAQHDLFAQVPSLRLDIAIPDYCYTNPPPPHHSSPLATKHSQMPQLDEPLLNSWFGPAGTISPLHTDPYHNILAQVVGRKYIRLYAPRESENLYARGVEDGGVDMGNTSATDIGLLAGWDGTKEEQAEAHERFPLFKDAEYVDCILEEGECLYIPVGWWHYVRSLSVSFSVSFWFN